MFIYVFAILALVFSSNLAAQPAPRVIEYQDWVKVCADIAQQERCEIQQTLMLNAEQGQNRLLRAVVTNTPDGLLMQLFLPLGVDLRPGIVLRIDEHPEFPQSFVTCLQDGCISAFLLNELHLQHLKTGSALKLGLRPFNSEQTLVFELSLRGFTRATQALLSSIEQ